MNSPLFLPILLQVIGVVVIIAEIVLPSGGLLTVIALALFGYSIYDVFAHASVGTGMIFVVADLIMVPVAVLVGIKLLSRSKVTLRTALSSKDGVVAQDEHLAELKGKHGTVVSALRPAGRAKIDGRKVDVVSTGDFVDVGAEVVVSEVNGNRVVVRQV